MREIQYEIVKEIAVLSTGDSGYTKEINLISWNGKEPKYDIRSFSPNREKCGNFWKAHCFINSLRLGSTFSPPFSLESWWCFPLFAGQYCLLKKTPKIFGFFSKNFLSSKIRLSEKPGQTYRYCKRYSDD